MQRSTFTFRNDGVTLRVAGPVDGAGPITLAVEVACEQGWRVRWRVDPETLRPLPATFTRHGRRAEPSLWQRKQLGLAAAWATAGELLREAADDLPTTWGLAGRDLGRLDGRTRTVDPQEVERLREEGMSESKIARRYGVTRGAVSVARGRAGTRASREEISALRDQERDERLRRRTRPVVGRNPFAADD